MAQPPKWYLAVAIVALLWNLAGCAAYLSDVRLTPEDVARMTAAQQALYAARPSWPVAATAIAVWGGAAGSLGLILRRRCAAPLLVASLLGLVAQDVSLFVLPGAPAIDATAIVLQSVVFLVGVGLVVLFRKATAERWIA